MHLGVLVQVLLEVLVTLRARACKIERARAHAVWGAVEVAVTVRAHICETEGRATAHAVWGCCCRCCLTAWAQICRLLGCMQVGGAGAGAARGAGAGAYLQD